MCSRGNQSRLHPVLINTIQQLAPYVSVPKESRGRHQTISSILDCLELIKELLIPITAYTELREAHPFIGMSFAAAKHKAWHWEDHLDDLGLEKMFYPYEQAQRDLKRVFDEEKLRYWGAYGWHPHHTEFNRMVALRHEIQQFWDAITAEQSFNNWRIQLDRMVKNPASLMLLSQYIYLEFISENFWFYQGRFQILRLKWMELHFLLERFAPYLSLPLNSTNPSEDDVERKSEMEDILRTIAQCRVLLTPFTIVIKGLPFILTGELPQTVDYDSDQ